MRLLSMAAWASLVLALVPPVQAAVKVGDKPALTVDLVGGGTFNLAALKGKMVIVDFWATWCKPCMVEAPHMVAINQKYAGKGVQIIGISLDDDAAAMVPVAQQQGFSWPQHCDGKGWESPVAEAWGVDSIPRTFIIGPDGDVLWTGHPGNIDDPLDQAMKDHPPKLVDDKTLADANSKLDDVAKQIDAHQEKAAIAELAQVPAEASLDEKFAARLAGMRAKLDAAGEAMLAEADPLIADEKYVDAADKLRDLVQGLSGSAAGDKAKAKLAELMAKPEAKAAIETARRKRESAAALAAAKKIQADKNDADAYALFKEIVRKYAGTPAAATAADAVKVYEQDPDFMKKMSEAATAAKAKGMLGLAAGYHAAGKDDLAKAKYQAVIDQFPGTPFAEQASKAIDAIGN